uniref:Uncharacterized protein n=1 Tax=Clytia hemisphaerica TaxID=252671 RepID=A0A7M5XI99_9CNID
MLDSDVIQDGDTIHFECNAMDHFFVPDTLKIKQKSLTIKMVNHQDTKQALNTITGLDCLNNKPLVEFIGNKSTDHREIKFIGIRFDNVTLFQNISHNVKLNFENCVFTGSRNLFESTERTFNSLTPHNNSTLKFENATVTDHTQNVFSQISFTQNTVNASEDTKSQNKNKVKLNDEAVESKQISISMQNSNVYVENAILINSGNLHSLVFNLQDTTIKSGTIQSLDSNTSLYFKNVSWNGAPGNTTYQELISVEHSNIVFEDISIEGQYNDTDFLKCRYCNIRASKISFSKDSTIRRGFHLNHTKGSFENIHINNAEIKDTFLNSTHSNLTFKNQIIVKSSIFDKPLFVFNVTNTIDMNQIIILKSTLKQQILTSMDNSKTNIKDIEIGQSLCEYEMFRTALNGEIHIDNINVQSSRFHQAFLAYGSNLETLATSGIIAVSRARFKDNQLWSTFFGGVDSPGIMLKNAILLNNTAENLWHSRRSNTTVQNLTIIGNDFVSGFIFFASDVFVNGITYRENLARSHGKALIYESTCNTQKRFIDIRNFDISVIDHDEYDVKSAIMDLEINSEFHLNMENNTIDIEEMKHSKISVLHLKFPTKNPNVLSIKHENPAIKVICPPSYNPTSSPKTREQFYSNQVDCLPCPRGSYTLARGSHVIDYVNTTDFDVILWDNDGRKLVIQNSPIIGECIDCPPGANCTYGIKSQGNYFGQVTTPTESSNTNNNITVEFMPCPPAYCCSNQGQRCESITTCNHHREGALCGSCMDGYYESYFSPKCIDNKICTPENQQKFWVIYIFTAFLITIAIFATKDVVLILIAIMLYIQKRWVKVKRKLSRDGIRHFPKHASCIMYHNQRVVNNCLLSEEKPRRFIFSAVLQITLSFFQIVSLLTLRNHAEENKTLTRIIDLFNLQIAVKEAEEICPFQSINIIWISFIKNLLIIATMLSFLFIFACCFAGISYFKCKTKIKKTSSISKKPIDEESKPNTIKKVAQNQLKTILDLSVIDRILLCSIKILMFGYKNISLFTIVSLHCVEVHGDQVLYISGEIKCYQMWQWFVVVLLVIWIVPFPTALVLSYRLYDAGFVNRFWFIVCLLFPPLAFVLTYFYRKTKSRLLEERQGLHLALYDVFEAPYRVIETHSTGDDSKQRTLYWWTAWRLYERLFIAMLVTFIIEPLFRMCVVAPVMAFLSIFHYQIKPYKKTMTLLSLLDISSYVFLTFYVVDNMFRSFAYTFDLPLQNPIDRGLKLLGVFEALLTPLTVICLFFVTLLLEALYEVSKTLSKKSE